MKEPRGWYQETPDEWKNDDFSYPLTVETTDLIGYYDNQAYVAYIWIEHPGVFHLKNGDPGNAPEWEDYEVVGGPFDTLDEAQQAAEVAVSEWEARDAALYAEMEAIAARGGWDE